MFNLIQMLQMLKSNPNAMMNNYFQNNPLFIRANEMLKGKDESEIKQVLQNVCEQKGLNLDDALAQFKNILGIK